MSSPGSAALKTAMRLSEIRRSSQRLKIGIVLASLVWSLTLHGVVFALSREPDPAPVLADLPAAPDEASAAPPGEDPGLDPPASGDDGDLPSAAATSGAPSDEPAAEASRPPDAPPGQESPVQAETTLTEDTPPTSGAQATGNPAAPSPPAQSPSAPTSVPPTQAASAAPPTPTPLPATPVPAATAILTSHINVQSDCGAVANGSTDAAAAINNCIKQAPAGSTVVFAAGSYALGATVYPKTGVDLQFEPGATLRFTNTRAHGFDFNGVSDISVTGLQARHEGTSGTNYNIWVRGSRDLTFRDLTILRNDSVAFSVDTSDRILIDGYVNRDENPRNRDDALDIRNSRSVTLRNFDLTVQDDAISLKTMPTFAGATADIVIESGVIRSRDSGIAIGTEIAGPIHDIVIRNVQFVGSGVPLYFKNYEAGSSSGRAYGGQVSRVRIQNVQASGSSQRFLFFHTVGPRTDLVRDVSVENAHFSGSTQFQCIYIQRQSQITLRNVSCTTTCSGGTELLLEHTHHSRLEGVKVEGGGCEVPIRLDGTGSAANTFVGVPPARVGFMDGALQTSQTWHP